jgi:methionyl-tRNA formyltransferase
MGTAPFAVPSLQALHAAGYPLLAVVTQPDRPHGRGAQVRPGPVKRTALELGLPVLQPEKASDPAFIAQVAALAPGLIAVVAYGQILRPALLALPPLGCVNVHGSVLPELRGAAPIQWAVIRGYQETGVTTMFIDPGMDTGDLLLQATEPICPADTAGSLAERLAPVGAALLVETVRRIERGEACRQPQDPERATYAPLLRKEDGLIDWSAPAAAIRNRIHGCNPAPGAYTYREGRLLKLWRAEALPETALPAPLPPGTVAAAPGGDLRVAAGTGLVRLLELQPESRARLSGAEFRRGYQVQAGEHWNAVPSKAAPA